MFISGLWHGAGYTFVVWGLLHGMYLTVDHGWRLLVAKFRRARAVPPSWSTPGFLLTFVSVVLSMVFFRAPTMQAAWAMLAGILGAHGIGAPAALFEHLGPLQAVLQRTGGGPETWWGAVAFVSLIGWTVLGLAIVLFLPNSGQLLSRYAPALGVQPVPPREPVRFATLSWSASVRWGLALAVLAGASILRFGGPSEFLYWQF
jgi:alginate O-acetyltransferase complex protein AlgI